MVLSIRAAVSLWRQFSNNFFFIDLTRIAPCKRIRKLGISNPINDWNPESKDPETSTWNPESTAWNPEYIIEKSFNSEGNCLIRPSRLAIKFRQPTDAICIDNIQEKVSLT